MQVSMTGSYAGCSGADLSACWTTRPIILHYVTLQVLYIRFIALELCSKNNKKNLNSPNEKLDSIPANFNAFNLACYFFLHRYLSGGCCHL